MSSLNSSRMRELNSDDRVGLAQGLFADIETEDKYRIDGIRAYDFLNGYH